MKIRFLAAVGVGVLVLATKSAFAAPTYINGGINFNSTSGTPFTMNGGALLAGATEFTSIDSTAVYVSSSSGSYSVIPFLWGINAFDPGSAGTINFNTFSFGGYGVIPAPASITLWTVTGPFGTYSFYATTMAATYSSSSGTGQWAFSGSGIAYGPGYAPTAGTWTMTASESVSGPETAFNWNSTAFATGSSAPVPPAILSQPQSQTVNSSASPTFTVTANGAPSLAYQWQFNGQNIAGATASALTLDSVGAGNSGGYSVVVMNSYGSVTSATAFLAVLADGANGNTPVQVSSSTTLTKLPGKNTLVIVTHGCQPSSTPPPPPQWVSDMCNAMETRVPNDCQIFPYFWPMEAWAPPLSAGLPNVPFSQGIPTLVALEATVMPNAIELGQQLGTQIAAQSWQHVHFIGHSAGAALIQKAADTLHLLAPATEIHTTFLDPYLDLDYYGKSWYGQNACWSDCYYALDMETHNFTDGPLVNTYNVDVTWVDPNATITTKYCYEGGSSDSTPVASLPCGQQAMSTHDWPHDFYFGSIVGTLQSCATGYGFALSKEGGGWNNHGNLPPNPIPLVPCGQAAIVQNQLPINLQASLNINLLPNGTSAFGTTPLGNSGFSMTSDDPAWTAIGLAISNAVDFIQFDTVFADTNAAQGLLTVYWDTNQIGTVDERAASTNYQTHRVPLPTTVTNGLYTLSFRLDSFSNTSSTITITNVATGFIGLTEPIMLGMSLNTNAMPILQLTAAPGFDYLIQSSTNLLTWMPAAFLPNTNGSVLFAIPQDTNINQCFYQAMLP